MAREEFDDHYCNSLPQAPGTSNLASQLTACASAFTTAASDCNETPLVACELRGTLPWRAPCVFPEQCASGACMGGGPTATTDMACGVCSRLVAAGGDCSTADTVCDSDSFCDGAVCQPYAHEGDDCSAATCTPGYLECDVVKHTCTRQPGLGEPCVADCAWTLLCASGTCTATGETPLPTCGMYCAFGGVDAGNGQTQACACAEWSLCNGHQETDMCHPVKRPGEPCTIGVDSCGGSQPFHSAWLACTNGTCQEPDFSSCH
jgi:hypothetical protein